MTQDARVVLVANGGSTNLRAAWSDTPAASWASAATANLPTFANGTTCTWAKLAYSPSLNILVAINPGSDNLYNNITTSGDGGTTWAQRQYPNANAGSWVMNDICWAPTLGLFVIACSAGPTSSTRILTSPDGIHWTAQTLPTTGISLVGVTCGTISGADVIVAVGTNLIYTSTDGVTWTSRTSPSSQTWSSVCWNSGQSKFVACANSGSGTNNIMYSSDGTSWTAASTGGSINLTRIGYSVDLDQMICVGGNGSHINYSTAGSVTSWTQRVGIGGSDQFSDVCWSHDHSTWVLVSSIDATIYTCATCSGTFASQTTPNTNSWAGCVAIPASTVIANNLGLDPQSSTSYPYFNALAIMSGFNGVSTHTMSLTSGQSDEVILIFVEMEQLQATGAYATVSSITGGSGLTWARYGSAYQYRGGRNGSSPFNWNTMEVWWAHASAVQTSQTITVNTSATVDNLSAFALGVIGANTSAPFDTNGLFTNNGGTSGTATTPTTATNAVTTAAGNELIFAFSGAPRSISTDSPPTGYVTEYMGGDPSGTDWGYQETAIGQPSTALSAATVAFGGSYTVANWGMIVGAITPTSGPPTGTWHSTEATDMMAFPGGVLGGSWHSTEYIDTADFVGGHPNGPWHSTEAADTMGFVGHPELSGVWSSIEITDAMAFTAIGPIATYFDPTTASHGVDFQNLNMTVVNQEGFGEPVGARSNTSYTTGKLYVEFFTQLGNNASGVGIGNSATTFANFGTALGVVPGYATGGAGIFQAQDGTIWINGVEQTNWSGVSLYRANIGVAIDLVNELIWFRVNGGHWNGIAGANPANGVASPRPPANGPQAGSGGYDISSLTGGAIYLIAEIVGAYDTVAMNAGASAFSYGAPVGFSAWDSAAQAAPALQMDGYATSGISEVASAYNPIMTGTVTLSTTQNDDVIVLGIATGGFYNAARVESITSTSGLVWKRRNRRWQVGGYKGDGSTIINTGLDTEIWWAHAPTALSGEVITVNMDPTTYPGAGFVTTSGTGSMSLIAFGVSGANYTTPWDAHTQAGGFVDNIGNIFYTPATAELSTKANKTFLIGFHGDTLADTGITQDPWTYVTSVTASEHLGYPSFLSLVYQIVEEPQFNTNVVYGQTYAGYPVFQAQSMMFDSIVAAGESGTNAEVVWFWDAGSTSNIQQLSTGTTLQLSYSATNFNLMVLIEVVIMSASGNGEVTSISEGQGSLSSTGFERRSRTVTNTPKGSLAVEIWWGWMPMYTSAERANNDTITINTINAASGDIIGAIMFGLGGTTGAFGLGDPFWDVNPSVPAANNSTVSSPPYATDISTTIPSDLLVAWTANNTENVPGFTDPFVTLVQAYPATILPIMQLNSLAPPLYTGFEFFYEPGLATSETAEFLAGSPEPDGWIVVADAIPVGPPQPPIGTMHPSDPPDKFTHTGNYTAIGIASPGGWVGAPENHGVITAIEHEDICGGTPNLGYAPFLGEGWLGGVAAHATWHSTESDDQMALYGWVLGFGITGQLNAPESKDRMASSNRTTVTGTMGAVETKDRWASAGLVLPPGHIHPTTPRKRRLLIVT